MTYGLSFRKEPSIAKNSAEVAGIRQDFLKQQASVVSVILHVFHWTANIVNFLILPTIIFGGVISSDM